ncbi:hypothetical protein ROHU_011952 [Labeo rohita]|uniref:Uncharacterized protein n=1 Tax=Labeo rohita TaxID=84645 RepID=A0A498LNW4_LABRO|nr:hypothetical protein ROHU_011952 [Labeo rohita]
MPCRRAALPPDPLASQPAQSRSRDCKPALLEGMEGRGAPMIFAAVFTVRCRALRSAALQFPYQTVMQLSDLDVLCPVVVQHCRLTHLHPSQLSHAAEIASRPCCRQNSGPNEEKAGRNVSHEDARL